MFVLIKAITLLLAGALGNVAALPYNHIDATVNAVIDAGTFSNPSVNIRPKFRYWLPDASVDPSLVTADIKGIGEVGAGGIEFLSYYLYGGADGAAPVTDWDIYGFGTVAFNGILKAAAQATKDSGLIMDFEMGPQSGQGVPAEPDNPGLSYNLISFNTTVKPGSSYNGTVPGWGSGTLVSITTAMIVNITSDVFVYTIGVQGEGVSYSYPYTLYTVAADSFDDVSHKVNTDGTINLSFPANSTAVEYIIYASYYDLSLARACIPGPNPTNFIQNGSFAVDHFSAKGAQVTTDFLEQYVLINGIKELFIEIGNYIWEDSMEVPTTVYWTPALTATFRSMHGYNIGQYTMLLSQNNANGNNQTASDWYITDAVDEGFGYVADYRDTLAYLYGTYLDHFQQWSHDYLGLQFSTQVSASSYRTP